jgi:serine/threonine protein kinase
VPIPFSEDFLKEYSPIRFLGKGAMGSVFLMRDVKLARQVAVKVVNQEHVTPEMSKRLVREAQVLSPVNHPNLITIYAVGQDGTLPYMVSEYVEGETLSQRLERPPSLSIHQILRVMIQILDGLRTAHKQGIIHRDLKPGNIFMTSAGKPKIGDFGLAKSVSAVSGSTVHGLLGTPHYMSPEQCRGDETSASSDIYAVGIMLFEMLTGRKPFLGPSLLDLLNQHTSRPAPRVSSLRPDVPPDLDAAVARALEKAPASRFRSANEFRKSLLEIDRALTPRAPGPTGGTPAHPPGPEAQEEPETIAPSAGMLLAGRYELARLLGQGGGGQVWLGRDTVRGGIEVAIKLLPPELGLDPEARASVVQEANLSLKLAHPDIVRIINVEPGDVPFLVMEYVAGRTLSDELASRKSAGTPEMTVDESLPILEAVARGLDYAHERGVVHRDIKPSNILLEVVDGRQAGAKVADFGIAAELTGFRTRRTGDVPTGTLLYMSPEQVTCQKVDRRSDVYSLAVTIYQMLTGSVPFKGGDVAYAIEHIPVSIPDTVPPAVAAVLSAALSKTPEDRPATAGELVRRLREADRDRSPARLAGRAAEGGPPTGPAGRGGILRLGLVSGLLAVVAGGFAIAHQRGLLHGLLPQPAPPSVPASPASPSAAVDLIHLPSARPPPAEPTGLLVIEGAAEDQEVAIDGKVAGRVPGPFSVAAGVHGVEIRAGEKFDDLTLNRVVIKAGETNTQRVKPAVRLARLQVLTTPAGAAVWIKNKKEKPKDPSAHWFDVPCCEDLDIEARLPGYQSDSQRAKLLPGERKTIMLTLVLQPITVRVTSDPPGALVTPMEGVPLGVTPLPTLTAFAGQSVKYHLSLAGYKSVDVSGMAEAGKTLELSAKLEKIDPPPSPSAPALTAEDRRKRDKHFNSGKKLYEAGNFDGAIEPLLQAAEVDNQSADTYRYLGYARYRQGKMKDAVAAFERAVQLGEYDAPILNTYANVLIRTQNAKRAVELAEKLVKLVEDNAEYWDTLGSAYKAAQRKTEAKDAFKRALEIDPEHKGAKKGLKEVSR